MMTGKLTIAFHILIGALFLLAQGHAQSLQSFPAAQLVCELTGPDTIRYVGDGYEPDVFYVDFSVENIGTEAATNVKAMALQDDGIIAAPNMWPVLDIGTIPAQFKHGFGTFDGLWCKVVPRATDGLDTITVIIVADNLPPAVCLHIVYIEREKRPYLDIVCELDPRLPMVYDPATNDYSPNPFEVTTTVTNTGTAPIYDGQVAMILGEGFIPYGQNSVQPAPLSGVLNPGESVTFTWNIIAQKQDAAVTKNITFQALGSCCGDGRLVAAAFWKPVLLPPVRAAKYELLCESPDELVYDVTTGSFIPDPLLFTVRVTNTGTSEGRGIRITTGLPSRLFFSAGQVTEEYIPSLPAGQSTTLTWLLRPTAENYEMVAHINASLVDTFGTRASCTSQTLIPPATEPSLSLFCAPQFDSLTVVPQYGDYGPTNPFKVYLTITNDSPNPVYDVEAMFTTTSSDILILGTQVQAVASVMNPNDQVTLEWIVVARPRTQSSDIDLLFRVTSSNMPPRTCMSSIYIPEIGRPVLDCHITRLVSGADDHIIRYDPATGQYEGTTHPDGYSYITLTVNVMNVGEARAAQVRVQITPLDGGATLVEPDRPVKSFEEGSDLAVGAIGHASWNFRPVRPAATQVYRFEVRVISANAEVSTCIYELTFEASDRVARLSIPDDLDGHAGSQILVPVRIQADQSPISLINYRLNVQFEPSVLEFIDAIPHKTLTGQNWGGPRTWRLKSPGSAVPDVVHIRDAAMFPPSRDTGDVLIYLRFKVLSGVNGTGGNTTALAFIDTLLDGGTVYTQGVNCDTYTGGDCDFKLATTDGMITLHGNVAPAELAAAQGRIEAIAPNPFNPQTYVYYAVPARSRVVLEVYDMLGRRVGTLLDREMPAGSHRVAFDASGLPSGMYYAQMTCEGRRHGVMMILSE